MILVNVYDFFSAYNIDPEIKIFFLLTLLTLSLTNVCNIFSNKKKLNRIQNKNKKIMPFFSMIPSGKTMMTLL